MPLPSISVLEPSNESDQVGLLAIFRLGLILSLAQTKLKVSSK